MKKYLPPPLIFDESSNFLNCDTNFQIDPSQDTTSINISNFPVGYYVIVLVCDGEQVDNKIIQKL